MPISTGPTLNITLRLGSIVFPITIKREDEKLYHDAERLVNERLGYYATTYPKQPRETHLTMLALDLALALQRNADRNDTEPFKKSMTTLLKEIADQL